MSTSTFLQILDNLTSTEYAKATRELITNMAHQTSYYGEAGDSRLTTGGSQISITAGNGDAVSVTTSLNSVYVNLLLLMLYSTTKNIKPFIFYT